MTASLEEVNSHGLAVIKFSQPLDISNLTLKDINSTVLDLSVEPYGYLHDPDHANILRPMMNLTWNCIKLEPQSIYIKIVFENPKWVSSQVFGLDELFVVILKTRDNLPENTMPITTIENEGPGALLQSVNGSFIRQRDNLLVADIRRQFINNTVEQQLATVTEAFQNQQMLQLIFGLVISQLEFSSAFFLMTSMINTLKIAMHLPIMNFTFPSNVMVYLQNIIPVVMFDLMNS